MKRIISLILLASLCGVFACGCGAGSGEKYADEYIDLHLHLDGAVTIDIAKKLAEMQNIALPTDSDEELGKMLTVSADCTSLNEFLECFAFPLTLMQTPEGLSEAVYLVAENIRSQGVVYAEIRWAPQLHTDNGMTQRDAIEAALDGLSRTELKANLILCCMRGDDTAAANLETVELASEYLVKDGGVVAVDLAGAEGLYPTADYSELFAKVNEYGIPFTLHAGEAAGAESVKLAIEYGAKRIGHGVRITEDAEVMKLAKEKGVFLEMCPTSNRITCAVEDMSKYPLVSLMDYGIKVTLNTDDMGIEGITLADEFRYMEREFGLTAEQERKIISDSIDAAFTTEEVKAELRSKLLG